jgi:SP family arabinose:H+ symporter-like MFS transporter
MSNREKVDQTVSATEGGRFYAFFLAFVAAIAGFLFGYDLVIISGAAIFIKAHFALSPAQFGFAVSSAILGCIAGPFLGGWFCDWIGRKSTLMLSGVLFAVGAIGAALAETVGIFNLFRFVGGLGVGVSSLAAPVYISEIAPARQRGRLGIMYQLAITVGALAAALVSYLLARYVSSSVSWRWMFASVAFPVVVFVLLLLKVPQGPRWLAVRQRFDGAFQCLIKIDGVEHALKEMAEIKASLSGETGTWGELFQPGMRLALFTGVMLAIFNNFTGWSGIGYYVPTLLQEAGYSRPSDAIGMNVFIEAGTVFLTLIAISLVDRAGRRPLWLATSAAMIFCLGTAGLIFQLHITGPLVVATIFLCAIPHAIGLGPLPWLMMSELYPTRIRARAVSISTTFIWVAGFTSPFTFPIIQVASRKVIGSIAGVFWFYAAICVVPFFWGRKFLPETKGRSLEEIASSWRKTGKATATGGGVQG